VAAAPDVNALAEDGLLRILRGDREGAFPLLERAVELGCTDLAILIELARAYRLKGRPLDAIRLLAPVIADANEPAARYELVRARLDAGDFQTALDESTRLIEALDLSAVKPHELPVLVDVYEVGAEAARGTGDSIRASVLYNALHGLLLRYNRRDLAEQVRRLEQQHVREGAERSARLEVTDADAPQRHVTDLLVESRGHLDHGRVFAALDTSYDALALDSMNLRPFLDIAACYVTADQAAAATTLLRSIEAVARLRGDDFDLAPAQRLLGRLGGDRTLREQAITAWLEQGRTADASDELGDLAEEAEAAGDWPRAEADLQRLLELEPDHTAATVALARLHRRAGRPRDALSVLTAADGRLQGGGRGDTALALWATAVTQLPDMAEVRQAYGERLMRRGRPREGAQELSWAADIATRQGQDVAVDMLLRAAQVQDELDDLPAALRTYDRLMRQAPGNAQVQEHFVGFCLRRGRADLAGKTLRTLADYLLGQSDASAPATAVAALTQLMVLRPDDAWAYEQLAAILTREGRPQESLMVYRQLAGRRPDDPIVAERVRALSSTIGASTQGPATEG
jgi:tetratricopeptide (TPR) repeat protein